MKNFEFHRPQKLDEAVKIFGNHRMRPEMPIMATPQKTAR